VRLPDDKFVCIVRAGDILAVERAESYRRKGLSTLYLPRETRDQFVRGCELALRHEEQLVAKAVADPAVPAAQKAARVLRLGGETMKLLKAVGLTDAQLAPALRFVEQVTELTRRLASSHPILEALLRDAETSEHGAGAALIGTLVAQAIGVTSESELNAIGAACLLHDISMINAPEGVRSERPETMSDAQRTQYLQHPAASARILAEIAELPASVSRMAAEHHMRRTNEGFPSRKLSDRTHLDSEIVGLSEEFARLLASRAPNPIETMKAAITKSFSADAANAFTRAFSVRGPAR
jgi:response regulator RpfG family c-di-GMP phosphodiesterase